MRLNPEEILQLLGESGPFVKEWSDYAPREGQKEMVLDLVKAINEGQIALIEAETGLGKSLAYLLPSILLAYLHKKRVSISTKTIQLQEQLLNKEIPAILHALQIDLKPTLVKGMQNYLCLQKVDEAYEERLLFTTAAQNELEEIIANPHALGTRQELSLTKELSERVFAESDHCLGNRCPHFENCHFFKARKETESANFLVVNHSLFFADLKLKQEKGSSSLSNLDLLVFDEAHHLETTALDHMASRLSLLSIIKNLHRLSSEKSGGKLFQLKEKLTNMKGVSSSIKSSLLDRLRLDFPRQEREIFLNISDLSLLYNTPFSFEMKIACDTTYSETPFYQNELVPHLEKLKASLFGITALLQGFHAALESELEGACFEKIKILLLEIGTIASRLTQYAHFLTSFLTLPIPSSKVRWIEKVHSKEKNYLSFIEADLDLSSFLRNELFEAHPSVVMTSATLTTQKDFRFIKERLGLESSLCKKAVVERQYPSTFNYKKNALFFVPAHIPLPDEPSFSSAAILQIKEILSVTKGGALVLFTSYEMMNQFASSCDAFFHEKKMPFFKQGEGTKRTLIEEFQKSSSSVLFGTDTFWEGVDIRKKALRCVIIVKLPFKVPTDPLTRAQHAHLASLNKSPFLSLSLPEAIVKFKQGFGRLIRHPNDRGVVICLDRRIYTKSYGVHFLTSLPDCEKEILDKDQIERRLSCFFRSK